MDSSFRVYRPVQDKSKKEKKMKDIENKLKEYLLNSARSIQEVLFIQDDSHPVWTDNLEILELAQKQILQPLGPVPGEHIYAFVGVHAKTVITGKRESLGFLLTNFRVLTQTDFSVLRTAKNAKIDFFTRTQLPEDLAGKIWDDFITENRLSIGQEQLSGLSTALKSVIKIVLPQLQNNGHLPHEIKKSSNIFERIKDLGLQEGIKNFSENEKNFKKFSEKHNVPDIICGTIDKPLFGGVYGLVFTKHGITSRNLMEDSVESSWQEIKENAAGIGSKKDIVIAGKKNHTIPFHKSELVPSLIILINEIANGEILI